MPQARLAEGHGFVVVVQVAARSRAVEIGAYERDLRREEPLYLIEILHQTTTSGLILIDKVLLTGCLPL